MGWAAVVQWWIGGWTEAAITRYWMKRPSRSFRLEGLYDAELLQDFIATDEMAHRNLKPPVGITCCRSCSPTSFFPFSLRSASACRCPFMPGFISGRIVVFREMQNRINEIITANSGPFGHSDEIQKATNAIEMLTVVSQRLDDQGNSPFSKCVFDIEMQMNKALGELESDYVYSETRMKSDPASRIVSNDKIRDWYSLVDNGRPSLKYVLSLKPTV